MNIRNIALALMLTAATALPHPALAQDKPHHSDGMSDYLRFAPWVATYTLKAAGVEGSSSWKRCMVNSALSMGLTVGVTYTLKQTIHEKRPDGTDNKSFPSGHTAAAFAGAAVLDKEYRKVSPWISVAGYAVATTVAVDRVCRNHHHWHDVAAGAAIGLLSTEAAYWLGDKITGERSRWHVGTDGQTLSLVVEL